MKKNIHPESFLCKIRLADGTETEVNLTKKIENLKLDLDYTNHPAWNKVVKDHSKVFAEIIQFKEKFKDLEV